MIINAEELLAESYFNKNIYNSFKRDAIIVSLSNCLTSVFAGFVVKKNFFHLFFYFGTSIVIKNCSQGLCL